LIEDHPKIEAGQHQTALITELVCDGKLRIDIAELVKAVDGLHIKDFEKAGDDYDEDEGEHEIFCHVENEPSVGVRSGEHSDFLVFGF